MLLNVIIVVMVYVSMKETSFIQDAVLSRIRLFVGGSSLGIIQNRRLRVE